MLVFAAIFDGRFWLGMVLFSTFWICGGGLGAARGACGVEVAGESGWADGEPHVSLVSLARQH